VHIIYDTITRSLFWAYDLSERIILCVYDLCAYDLSGRMILSEPMICVSMILRYVWFVCLWLFCAYDFHDDAPVPIGYCKNLNKWARYSDFLNFWHWNNRILLLTLTYTWGCPPMIRWTRVRKWTLSARSYMHSPDYMGHFPINPWGLVLHSGIHCWLDTFSACLGY